MYDEPGEANEDKDKRSWERRLTELNSPGGAQYESELDEEVVGDKISIDERTRVSTPLPGSGEA